jgi:superfamily I DNA and/or RNA helicase
MANDTVCEGGLARYGATESLYLIEDIGCVTNRDTTDMEGWHNIVVATAARYAYDFVQPDDTPICDYPWDYIFIDEASMIDILTITYILYKGANAKKIIISGDPKQIQPVVQNDMPAYNIYDMVNLHEFADALFNYDRYPVKGLMTQHRSVPTIGDFVSKFAYGGLVDADPDRSPQKPLKLDGLRIADVNFVGFDVAEFDDIRGLCSVGQSAFNLYSAIFTYNMIEYTIKQIEKNHPDMEYSIGVVCAYRAQSDAIKNMLENRPLDTSYCKVTSGTVHSFQGDECDIMFIVLNPPANCTSGAHVNNENIINVAISRARDYIFFVLPNGQQQGFTMKNRIGSVIPFTERTVMKCRDVEKVMFHGNENYIYENTHVTCHMPVNVYCEENALYEVRMSEDALDIKINQ